MGVERNATSAQVTSAKLKSENVSSNSSWAKKVCGWDADNQRWQFETC